MILYFFKTIICSALLLLFYMLIPEKQTMHRFNRFYLLLSIVFSFSVPFITIVTKPSAIPVTEIIPLAADPAGLPVLSQAFIPAQEGSYLPYYLLAVYLSVTTFLLIRYISNLLIISSRIKNNTLLRYAGAQLVLTSDHTVPHSFLRYIFLNKEHYEHGRIEKEIIQHELTHVNQQHSIDILLIELLLVFFWFHPLLYLYRKAIRLNHEFLADDGVVKAFHDTPVYLSVLLQRAGDAHNFPLTSGFNYSTTKKRFMMMTRTTSYLKAILTQASLLPFAAMIVFVFCTKLAAQEKVITHPNPGQSRKQDTVKNWVFLNRLIDGTKEGVSEELVQEFASIVSKYQTSDKKWVDKFGSITLADKKRLETIFSQMSRTQQEQQPIAFLKPTPPLPHIVPTKKQFESFKNPAVYGIWIDGRKVRNSVLDTFSNTDFEQVMVSKLYKNARRNVSYLYQANLMTRDYYQNYYATAISDKENHMVTQSVSIKR